MQAPFGISTFKNFRGYFKKRSYLLKLRTLVFSCCVALLSASSTSDRAWGQVSNWKSFTGVGEIRDLAVADGVLWSGSNGGVLRLDGASGEFTKFTNTEGLSNNEIRAVEIDQHGDVWFALGNGLLNRFSPATGVWEEFSEFENLLITDMEAFGDSLYMGLDFGVSLFTIDREEVKETYQNFGFSTGNVVEKVEVNAVFIDGVDIWVATDKGVAQSKVTLSNLLAPVNWNQHTTANGLPSNQISKVVVVQGVPYAGSDAGIARLTESGWGLVVNGLPSERLLGLDVLPSSVAVPESSVVALLPAGVYWLNASDRWERLGENFGDATALRTDDQGGVWIGREDVGLARFDFATNTWTLFATNGPASNNFKSLALDSKGRLWCASQRRGVHMFDGEQWTNFTTANGLSRHDQRTVVVDARDRVWVGSWGGGITIFEENGAGEFQLTKIDTTNGILAGSVSPTFVLVNGMARDAADNIWVLNRLANNTRVLAVHTPGGAWGHFSTNEGLGTPFVLSLAFDEFNRVWIGTEDRGLKVLDHRGTLFDKSDDDFTQGLNQSEGLASNQVTALARDLENVMWIGTTEGLNFWFGGQVGRRFGLINNRINAIGVDARNNKWIGTEAGVSMLSSNGTSVFSFTTDTSPLVNNNVQDFAFNQETGEVWIGTINGLSRAQTPFTRPLSDLTQLTGYPNPFIVDGGQVFTITNLASNTAVRIYDVAGDLVREFRREDIVGDVAWDGRDSDGNLVASGIYVYFAITDEGMSGRGKVAVIRR